MCMCDEMYYKYTPVEQESPYLIVFVCLMTKGHALSAFEVGKGKGVWEVPRKSTGLRAVATTMYVQT